MEMAMSGIHQYVWKATKPLFQRFSGHEFSSSWVQQITDDFLNRRHQ